MSWCSGSLVSWFPGSSSQGKTLGSTERKEAVFLLRTVLAQQSGKELKVPLGEGVALIDDGLRRALGPWPSSLGKVLGSTSGKELH